MNILDSTSHIPIVMHYVRSFWETIIYETFSTALKSLNDRICIFFNASRLSNAKYFNMINVVQHLLCSIENDRYITSIYDINVIEIDSAQFFICINE